MLSQLPKPVPGVVFPRENPLLALKSPEREHDVMQNYRPERTFQQLALRILDNFAWFSAPGAWAPPLPPPGPSLGSGPCLLDSPGASPGAGNGRGRWIYKKTTELSPKSMFSAWIWKAPPGPSPEPPGSRPWRGPLGLAQIVRIDAPNQNVQHAF